jgi:hypothetical protein
VKIPPFSAWQSRKALSSIMSSTALESAGEPAITRNISAMAVWRSSASPSSTLVVSSSPVFAVTSSKRLLLSIATPI